jgi:hypothetical protein
MTQNEFVALCLAHLVEPELALENEDIIEALEARDNEMVLLVLTTEF